MLIYNHFVTHYEIGRHHPDYTTLKRIADVLKVPSAYFYAEDDDLAEFIKFIGNTDKESRRGLLEKICYILIQKG